MLLSQNLWQWLVHVYAKVSNRCYYHRICGNGWYMYMIRYPIGASITESVAMVGTCIAKVSNRYYYHRICGDGWYMYMLRYPIGAIITESVAMVGSCIC